MHTCENFLDWAIEKKEIFWERIQSKEAPIYNEKICDLANNYFKIKKFKPNSINSNINALNFLFKKMDLQVKLQRTHCVKKTLQILTVIEMRKIMQAKEKPENKLLLLFAYYGMDIKEISLLKKQHIDEKEKIIKISEERHIYMPMAISKIFNENRWLLHKDFILGVKAKKAEKIIKKMLQDVKINKQIRFKDLKCSFIVHLLEKGLAQEHITNILSLKNNFQIKKCEFLTRIQNLKNNLKNLRTSDEF